MLSRSNESTRCLCASAFLSGSSFRQTVLKRLKEVRLGAAPELGLDTKLVAQVCKFAERRAIYYAVGFTVLLLIFCFFVAVIAGAASDSNDPTTALTGLYVFFVLVSGLVYFVKLYQEHYSLVRPFLRQSFDPVSVSKTYPPFFTAAADAAVSQVGQNLVVYRGFVPFVGAGIDFGGWSFAVSTIKASEDPVVKSPPKAFTISELYAEIEGGLDSLGIDQLSGEDFYFVSGSDIRGDREILPNEYGPPAQTIRPEMASTYKDTCDSRIRHYRWIRVEDWGGEIIMSMFLRCTLRGSNLFVEMKKFLLTPVSQKYRGVDKVGSPTFGTIAAWFIGSMVVGQFYCIYAFFFLLGRLSHKLSDLLGSEDRKIRHEIRNNPLFNYGVDKSLRDLFSSGEYHHYFQKLDTDFYGKVLEREILDSIVDFLDEHHIDTSEIKERKSTILNSGIIVQGGDIKAESLAVGTGAKAVKAIKKAAKGAEA